MKRSLTLTAIVAVLTLATSVKAQPAPASGMLLGVYAFQNYQGLRVTGTIPGYSAQGRIFRNDVLIRVTTDGNQYYSAGSHGAFEYAKDQIGPYTPAALEVFRPGVGMVYMWVEFQPVNGAPAAMALTTNARKSGRKLSKNEIRKMGTMKARIWTEREKPGASRLFKKSNTRPAPKKNPPKFRPNPPKRPGFKLPGGGRLDPSKLFGGR